MSRTSRTGAVSESGIVYFKAGGHSHDGINSTLIDTKKYSLFDFSVGQQQGSQDRITNQSRNEQSFKEYVIKLVNQSVLEPIGITLQDNAINSRHMIANSISAREIAANTITSDKIALNTITANNFANAIVLDAKIVRSNNYIAGTSGWVINGNGFAEFRNISIGGTSNINGVPIGNIATVVTNFETNNDQIATTPSDANSISFGTAIKNRDASIDLPVTWVYNQGGSTSNSFNVDGFVLYLRSSNTNNNANITISDINNSNVQAVYLTSDKRSHVFSGVPESTSYKAAIRAYRIVDTNVNANGILFSGFINSDIRNIGVPTIGGGTGISIGDGKIFIGAGNYSNADTGFFVDSDGKMSLKNSLVWNGTTLTVNGVINADSGVFKGSIDIGGPDNQSLQVDTDGNLWLGHRTLASAPFRVSPDGQLYVGTSPNWLRVDAEGNVWTGGDTFANAAFRVQDTGNVRIGNAATSLHIANNGSITIGTLPGTGDFIVQSNGQVDVGGNDLTSFHISPSGNLWVGANSTSFSTAPLKITNDGSVDIGTSDAQSLHISASGNIHVGAAKANFLTAPFSVVASNGDVKGNNITLSGQILGTATHLGKADVVNIIGNIAIGASKIFATAGANYSNGFNYTLSAADGFLARLDSTDVTSITAAGYKSSLDIQSLAGIYGGELYRENNSSNLTVYSTGKQARWEDSNEGKLLGSESSSSKRYKKNIKILKNEDLDANQLLKLNVVQFKYKNNYLPKTDQNFNKDVPGFIAEDVYNVYPIACQLDSNGNPESWEVKFILPPMLKLIQDLYKEVEILKERIDKCQCC